MKRQTTQQTNQGNETMFFNEYEIQEMAHRAQANPELAPFGQIALRYVDIVNSNSDGWPYWSAASKSASRFLNSLHKLTTPHRYRYNEPMPTTADLRKALAPMKALLTKRGLPPLT